jgi:hypothetical protein
MEMFRRRGNLPIEQTMSPIKGEQLLTQLNWRYATKKFNPTQKISPEDWSALETALILSPSSYGLQPWKFVVITEQKTHERLFRATWKQRQVLDCSHYLVFAVNTTMTEGHIDRHLGRVVEVRGEIRLSILLRFLCARSSAGDLRCGLKLLINLVGFVLSILRFQGIAQTGQLRNN